MGHWIVVNGFGQKIAGPYISKGSAESVAKIHPDYAVVYDPSPGF